MSFIKKNGKKTLGAWEIQDPGLYVSTDGTTIIVFESEESMAVVVTPDDVYADYTSDMTNLGKLEFERTIENLEVTIKLSPR